MSASDLLTLGESERIARAVWPDEPLIGVLLSRCILVREVLDGITDHVTPAEVEAIRREARALFACRVLDEDEEAPR